MRDVAVQAGYMTANSRLVDLAVGFAFLFGLFVVAFMLAVWSAATGQSKLLALLRFQQK